MSRFKVGDKVRVKDWESVRDFFSLPEIDNTESIVVDIKDDQLSIVPACSTKPNCCFMVKADMFELVTPTDPKREFLERLQSLLREFDATIKIGWNNYFDSDNAPCIDMDIIFNGHAHYNTFIGFKNVLGNPITADIIMDFNKE